jgi:tRNA A-37 threonylcarbamoyl transferase component Bud32
MSQAATVRRTAKGLKPGGSQGDAPPPTDVDAVSVSATELPRNSATQDFAPGDLIGERQRYELTAHLGRGSMGTVFLAKDKLEEEYKERDPYVAIKFLDSEFASHPQARIALEREAKKARNLAHPNIVKVFYFDEFRGIPYMVMEYIRGMPLDDFLNRYPEGMPFEEAWPIVRDIGLGLAYIHKESLVHSDLKPGNVFVAESGVAKILDMGIARASSSGAKQRDATTFDASTLNALSPMYAAPEMFERQAPDPRDDIYALGCIAYELLTGRHVFDGDYSIKARGEDRKPARIAGMIERRWRALERALSFKRDERTETVEAFLKDFEALPDFSKRRLAIAAGASAVVASLLAAWLMPSADPDQVFVRGLLDSAGSATIGPREQERIDNWLAQGSDYIGFARESLRTDDALAAHRDLRGGTDNAELAFRQVLQLTPSEPAARGLLDIANTYADGAESLATKPDSVNALWLACQGYALHPNSPRLIELVDILGGSKVDADRATVCRAAQPK